jgi:cytochrome c-type biogenesis protein CcmH/NrfG
MKKVIALLVALCLFAAFSFVVGCKKEEPKAPETPAAPAAPEQGQPAAPEQPAPPAGK